MANRERGLEKVKEGGHGLISSSNSSWLPLLPQAGFKLATKRGGLYRSPGQRALDCGIDPMSSWLQGG